MLNVLNNIRVLDFGRYIAGPYCAHLLSRLGAEVIRIERPGGGEDRFIVPVTGNGEGAMFMQMNAGKKGLTLDIGSDAGREIIQKLVKTADIVVVNMPQIFLRKLGLDYESLRVLKRDIILVTNSAFGSDGPWADRPGFDGIGQAMSGAAWFSGLPGRPAKSSVTYVDYASALSATIGTLAAIMHRQQTGHGQEVETSLLSTALTLNASSLSEQAVLGLNRQPSGNRAQVAGPADIFDTKDGHIIVQVVGPYIFKRITRVLDKPEWLEDLRFADDSARGDARDHLCPFVAEWAATKTTEEALALLDANRVPSGPVLPFQQALDHPAVQALEQFVQTPYGPQETNIPIARPPVRFSEENREAGKKASPPPLIGEHSSKILIELGYSHAEIDSFRSEGII